MLRFGVRVRRWLGIVGVAAFVGLVAWPVTANMTKSSEVMASMSGEGMVATGKLVTIYDSGKKKVVQTDSDTVKDALEFAGVVLYEGDKVEPGLSEVVGDQGFFVNIYRAKPVIVIDGRRKVKVLTSVQEPRAVTEVAGVELFPEDKVRAEIFEGTDLIETGVNTAFVVQRAKLVNLVLYGERMAVRTQVSTVGEFLEERGIGLSENDYVSSSIDVKLAEEMDLEIWRNGVSLVNETLEIERPLQQIMDYDRDKGYLEVREEGEAGEKIVTYEIDMQNGVEVSRTQISEVVTKEPVMRVEVVGAKVQGSVTTPLENENITWDFLIAQGFSPEQTAGIMGNLMQEHRFSTTDARGGLGIAQWTGGRRAKLLTMDDPFDIHTQLEFLMIELNGGYSKVKSAILDTNSIEEAMRIFQNQFERCGVCMEGQRIQYAHNIYVSHKK